MNEPTYTYDQAWEHERERLAGIERLWDEGSRQVIRRLGLNAGWRVLEIGAGGGSMAEWFAANAGSVVATDLDTRFVEAVEADNLEVLKHDVMADPPPGTDFDLVHARLVVEHIGAESLPRMVACLKPGGVLLVEDYDNSSSVAWPEVPEFDRVGEAIWDFMGANGMDPQMGRKLIGELSSLGLEEVDGQGQVNVIRGGGPKTAFYEFTIQALRDVLVEQGKVAAEDCDRALELLRDPTAVSLSPVLMAAWGLKP